MRKIFPLETTRGELRYTRMLRDLCAPTGPKSGFAALGLQFPSFLEKPLSLKNVEHALCEYDKVKYSHEHIQLERIQARCLLFSIFASQLAFKRGIEGTRAGAAKEKTIAIFAAVLLG